MTTLLLTIKREPFDDIVSGVKTKEYRAFTEYYQSRLNRKYSHVLLRNGYALNSPHVLCELIKVTTKKFDGEKFYELHLGKIVRVRK